MIPWKDPREWMENMGSARWKARVAAENRAFDRAIVRAVATVSGTPEQFRELIAKVEKAQKAYDAALTWRAGPLTIVPQPGGALLWSSGSSEPLHKEPVGDLDYVDGLVVTTVDIGSGAEHYCLKASRPSGRGSQPAWSYKTKEGLGPFVAISGGRVYCLEAESPLRYIRLISLNMKGQGRKVHYIEHERSITLTLIKGAAGGLFLLSENAGRQRLYLIGPNGLQHLCPDACCVYPVGLLGGKPFVLYRTSFSGPWKCIGATVKIPAYLEHCGIELVAKDLIVLKDKGLRHALSWAGKELYSTFGEFIQNPWLAWKSGGSELRILAPGAFPTPIDSRLAPPEPLSGLAKSADGTEVRWVCVSRVKNPVGLVVIVYGAYGIPTWMNTSRWEPLLDSGVAIGFALIRGGGDDGEAWAEAGRREGKLLGVEDTEACIRSLQGVTGCGPERTALYGRSAGGYCVGTVVARNPAGDLIGTAYTEVPYVDVLKTAAAAALPLTEYEYLEFGNPAASVVDFAALLRLSPVHALGPAGAPGVAVLTRTGVNDMQVLAYESVKWVDALRGAGARASGKEKVVRVAGGGHFVRGGAELVDRAEDICWLLEKFGVKNRDGHT